MRMRINTLVLVSALLMAGAASAEKLEFEHAKEGKASLDTSKLSTETANVLRALADDQRIALQLQEYAELARKGHLGLRQAKPNQRKRFMDVFRALVKQEFPEAQ